MAWVKLLQNLWHTLKLLAQITAESIKNDLLLLYVGCSCLYMHYYVSSWKYTC